MPRVVKRKNFLTPIPEGGVLAARPSILGNPWKVGEWDIHLERNRTAADCVKYYEDWLDDNLLPRHEHLEERRQKVLARLPQTRGFDHYCYCGNWEPGQPEIDCHAVITLLRANPDIEAQIAEKHHA